MYIFIIEAYLFCFFGYMEEYEAIMTIWTIENCRLKFVHWGVTMCIGHLLLLIYTNSKQEKKQEMPSWRDRDAIFLLYAQTHRRIECDLLLISVRIKSMWFFFTRKRNKWKYITFFFFHNLFQRRNIHWFLRCLNANQAFWIKIMF